VGTLEAKFRHALASFKEAPPIRALREARYERAFARATGLNLFRGVYGSFEEARASAPATKPLGYDHDAPAAMYDERLARPFPGDYPALFWLAPIVPKAKRVFDFGGHVGIARYGFARHLDFPKDLVWTVLDVPAVIERGRALARERAEVGLEFTTDASRADGADVFFAAGSLQYVSEPLAEMLARLERRPPHVVVNKTPLYDGPSFFTLQNIGVAFCPYAIFNRDAFVEPVRALGYELVDTWENLEQSCTIPLRPDRSVPRYTGLYFRRR
jgi:putative methyltransferase (TIGR04325 family)